MTMARTITSEAKKKLQKTKTYQLEKEQEKVENKARRPDKVDKEEKVVVRVTCDQRIRPDFFQFGEDYPELFSSKTSKYEEKIRQKVINSVKM